MLWLLGRIISHDDVRFRLAVCDIAESVLRFVPAGEDRPRVAIETARRHLAGDATTAELRAARSAADAAAAYAGAAAANAAAYAAANAAADAANANAAADADADAAYAAANAAANAAYAAYAGAAAAHAYAANAAANDAARRTQNVVNCDVLRKHFEFASVMAALEAS
jgi:hypothetical protein